MEGEPPPDDTQIQESPPSAPAFTGVTLVSLIPHEGQEPPASLTDHDALAIWAAVSAPSPPRILARAPVWPRPEPVDSPSTAGTGELRLVASGAIERLPSGYRTSAEDAGAALLEGDIDRPALARLLLDKIEAGP